MRNKQPTQSICLRNLVYEHNVVQPHILLLHSVYFFLNLCLHIKPHSEASGAENIRGAVTESRLSAR